MNQPTGPYWCRLSRHAWEDIRDADKCCNGWRKVFCDPNNPRHANIGGQTNMPGIGAYGMVWVRESEAQRARR